MTISQNSPTSEMPRFTDVSGVPSILSCLKPSAVRWLIYKDPEFSRKCVFRLGRKILIGVPELFAFIEGRRAK